MLEIKNIKKSFGNKQVLKDVSLSVQTGEVIVILGPSGSGKTTLLRCINFLERADGGELTISDKTVNFTKVHKKDIFEIRQKTAFVFQNYNLFNNKTAIGNVMEGLVVARKIPKSKAAEIAKHHLDEMGLADKYDCFPSQLSGGQQQRVAIARALALNPDVILFDEPTSALDPELIGETLGIIKKIASAQNNTTIIIVTHEMSFAQGVAHKVVFMDDGFVVEEGSPDDIFLRPKKERTKQFLSRISPIEYNI
ncbi:MAG: amino acid ABC transporter ATP-binding protein [Elusimicrobiota bacterium]|jgi:L-cystine transport system ATP-binding protein|nr:amino acid ABC transporter ATP-binding protein [Elusimicrobiota bacterium]